MLTLEQSKAWDEVWMPGNDDQMPDMRRARRLNVTIEAYLREPGTTRFPIRVADLSATGFRCETSFTLVPGNRVWLTIPGLEPLEARVAWRDGFRFGCAFVRPLHVAVVDHIFNAFKDQSPPSG